MLKIGLTGGFGTGKSTVAGMFRSLGAKVLDADKMNHRLIHRGGACFPAVVKLFGKKILSGRDIDRKKIAAVVFKNRAKLQQLNAIVHPAVIRDIKKEIQRFKRGKRTTIIIDAPLLIEAGLHKLCDCVIVVVSGREKQIQRVMRRMEINRKEVLKRIRAQMPLKRKIQLADITIHNNGTRIQTRKEVRRIWQSLLKKIPKK